MFHLAAIFKTLFHKDEILVKPNLTRKRASNQPAGWSNILAVLLMRRSLKYNHDNNLWQDDANVEHS